VIAYILVLLASAAYLICYSVHCFARRRVLPGVGALCLLPLPLGFAAIFVFILLQALC